ESISKILLSREWQMNYPKNPRKENPALLKLAQGKPCLMHAAYNCLRPDTSTTVAAHSNELRHGKGRGMKAHDHYSVWACVNCHRWYDESGAPKAEKQRAFEAAHDRQIREWGALRGSDKRTTEAVDWALENLFSIAADEFLRAMA
ncbi:MAG: nuclease domain-containing protein, partial [Shewanella sp.]